MKVGIHGVSYRAAAYKRLGNAFASTGDSGKLHIWKQNLDGHFIEFAETGLD